jgi:hypothetical protein
MMKLVLLMTLLGATAAAEAQPARVILIRHAEKPKDDNDPRLSAEGKARAQHLVEWVASNPIWGTNPPTALYVARPTPKGRGIRCRDTLEPLARHLQLELKMPYVNEDYLRLADDLMHDPKLQKQTVLVCWTHEELPEFAQALGVKPKPPKWKDKDFDGVYVVTLSTSPPTFERVRQSKGKTF